VPCRRRPAAKEHSCCWTYSQRYAARTAPTRATWLLLDDIDQWLYPRVQGGLIKLWPAAFEFDHSLQIIAKKLMLSMTKR
jgi:hypothetical protein